MERMGEQFESTAPDKRGAKFVISKVVSKTSPLSRQTGNLVVERDSNCGEVVASRIPVLVSRDFQTIEENRK